MRDNSGLLKNILRKQIGDALAYSAEIPKNHIIHIHDENTVYEVKININTTPNMHIVTVEFMKNDKLVNYTFKYKKSNACHIQ